MTTARDRSFLRALNRDLSVEWVEPTELDWCFFGLLYDDTYELVDPVAGSVRMPMNHKDLWSNREPLDASVEIIFA